MREGGCVGIRLSREYEPRQDGMEWDGMGEVVMGPIIQVQEMVIYLLLLLRPFYQSTRLIHLGERTSETTYERVPLKTSHVRTCVRACVCVAWRGGARINSSLRFTSD